MKAERSAGRKHKQVLALGYINNDLIKFAKFN